jgi:hypothetical protein
MGEKQQHTHATHATHEARARHILHARCTGNQSCGKSGGTGAQESIHGRPKQLGRRPCARRLALDINTSPTVRMVQRQRLLGRLGGLSANPRVSRVLWTLRAAVRAAAQAGSHARHAAAHHTLSTAAATGWGISQPVSHRVRWRTATHRCRWPMPAHHRDSLQTI